MSALRPWLLGLAVALLALPGCGRKGEPERPEGAPAPEPPVLERRQDDDPLIETMPPDATPGPRLEERVDETLDG